VNPSPDCQPSKLASDIRMGARLETMTRAKLDALAATFHQSRAAVLREGMRWGISRAQAGTVDPDDTHRPVEHRCFLVARARHQQVGEAAKAAGGELALWLRHLVRQITVAAFPRRWQAAMPGRATRRPEPRASRRSRDSRTHGKRFMLRVDERTWQTLERLADHFTPSHAEIIHQLIAQTRLEEFPERGQVAVKERRLQPRKGSCSGRST
jgi:predicted transcriptional regulator